jgi:hypothetical protein
MGDTRHQPPERCELFRLDQGILGLAQVLQGRFGRIPCMPIKNAAVQSLWLDKI